MLAAGWRGIARRVDRRVLLGAPLIACLLYLGWIFLFQNVLHKSRHVLPLLPFLASAPAFAGDWIIREGARWRRLVLAVFLCCYASVSLHLVVQHRARPPSPRSTAPGICARETEGLRIASVPLIKYYLASQALEAEYIPSRARKTCAPSTRPPPAT